MNTEQLARFKQKTVATLGALDTPCLVWTGAKDRKGYGQFSFTHFHTVRAHRAVYEHYVGPIPDGLLICHRCNNPSCVNHEHLYAGTQAENLQQMVEDGRSLKGDKNPSRLHPELRPRGQANGAYTHPEARPRGEKHGMARTNEQDVKTISELYATGDYTQQDIAEKFGVARRTVSDIVRGRYWAEVERPTQPSQRPK